MDRIYDLGGMHGLGPILNEESEPYFHHEWERQVSPLFTSLFVSGHFNVDESRHVTKHMDPAHYLEASYYEYWLHTFETLLLEEGVTTTDELQGGSTLTPCAPGTPVLMQDTMAIIVSTSAFTRVSHDIAPRFKVGDRIRAKNINPTTHTRLPRYMRGKTGRIGTNHGVFITPDTAARGPGEHSQHVYSVSFTMLELWGAPRPDNVYIDLWDDYLEEA